MPETAPSWLSTMRAITGTLEAPGAGDNPIILAWRNEIALRFPEMASYCALYNHDSIPWCGLTVGYCMAHNGIRPVFGPSDTDKFLWAQAWKQFGTPVEHPQPGDVLVFARHVSLYDGEDGDHYLCRGGNQSDSVNVTHFRKSSVEAIRRPPAAAHAENGVSVPVPISTHKRFTAITATMFGGHDDHNTSAYDGRVITDQEFGVALPARFNGMRPKVRVFKGDQSVVCNIVDVGPWNTTDPYWENGGRPQAESGVDRRGRRTNRAGIDLTPAAARAINLNGKGMVDWEFVGPTESKLPAMVPPAEPALDGLGQRFEQLLATVNALKQAMDMQANRPRPVEPAPTPANDLATLLQQVLTLFRRADVAGTAGPAPSPAAQQTDQLRKIVEIINALIATDLRGTTPTLGPVNGALGSTIGNLLNGRKTAIGGIGAILTALLGNIAPGGGLGKFLAPLIPVAEALGPGLPLVGTLSGFSMPIFLGLAAWGALGKLEKWAQGRVSPAPGTQ